MEVRHAQGVQIGQGNAQHNYFLSVRPAHSAYLHQVRRIAPSSLEGREAELAELAEFCAADGTDRTDGGSGYAWWRGPAWAGKSALMSWFVLHPPPGAHVVSFFITARFAGQNDRIAFTEVVIEQLAQLLDQPVPALLTPATRDGHFLDLLDRAAAACAQRGERLVLVVDGLDEDRGVTAGPDAYSIAALLPAEPPAGLRVIVAGRPNPPIPTDVPDGHPLRRPQVVRTLAVSPVAKVVRGDAERELKLLLRGEPLEQDLLGLLVAAGGGLSAADLAQLTGLLAWEIDERLTAVAGRTFQPLASTLHADRPHRFVLAHEELQQAATVYFGPDRLTAYADRLRAWADTHRRRGWPPDTPEYLLTGYFAALRTRGNLSAMVELATDRGRQDRMAALTASDATAMAELATCLGTAAAEPDPDLTTIARLALQRDHLNQRNTEIPDNLPELWLRLGHPQRGADLLHAMRAGSRRSDALHRFVAAAVETGDWQWVERWLRSPWTTDRESSDVEVRVGVLAEILVENDELGRATEIIETITDLKLRRDLARLVGAADAGIAPPAIEEPSEQPPEEWIEDYDRVLPTFTEEELAALRGEPPSAEDLAATERAAPLARAGRWGDADELIGGIRDWRQRRIARLAIAAVALVSGDGEHARLIMHTGSENAYDRDEWEVLAGALLAGDSAIDVQTSESVHLIGTNILQELLHRNEFQRAEAFIGRFTERRIRTQLLTGLAAALADSGRLADAERLAFAAADLARGVDRAWMVGIVELAVELLVATGRRDRAGTLLAHVLPRLEATELDADERFDLVMLRACVAEGDSAVRLYREAAHLTEIMDELRDADSYLCAVASAAATYHRNHSLARELAELVDDDRREMLLAELALLAVQQDAPELATAHWQGIEGIDDRAEAMLQTSGQCLADGDLQRAKVCATAAREILHDRDLPEIDCILALCEHDDERAEARLGALTTNTIAGVVAAELAGRWTARGDLAKAEALLRFMPDNRVTAKIAGALVERGEVQRAFELATTGMKYWKHVVLGYAVGQRFPGDVARRFLAAAFHYGYWEPGVRAAAAWDPGFAVVAADEVARLLGSHAA